MNKDWTYHSKGYWAFLDAGLLPPGARRGAAGSAGAEGAEGAEGETAVQRPSPSGEAVPASLVTIGSPNFGMRSYFRDLENQLYMVSESDAFRALFADEVDLLFNSKDVSAPGAVPVCLAFSLSHLRLVASRGERPAGRKPYSVYVTANPPLPPVKLYPPFSPSPQNELVSPDIFCSAERFPPSCPFSQKKLAYLLLLLSNFL